MSPTTTHTEEGIHLTRLRTQSTSESVPEIEDSMQIMHEALANLRKQKKSEGDEEKEATPDDVATSPTRDDIKVGQEYTAVQVWDKLVTGHDTDAYETD